MSLLSYESVNVLHVITVAALIHSEIHADVNHMHTPYTTCTRTNPIMWRGVRVRCAECVRTAPSPMEKAQLEIILILASH